jgi:guanosine-3',5'-bis(diphosphate) 3'-pyrophosphohydrolase
MSDNITRQLLEAASFSARAHHGQLRKDGKTPYGAHPYRVCLIVRHIFGFDDPRMLMAALLHDTIEDTTTDFDDLESQYGVEVASWVAFLTKDKRLQDDKREQEYIDGLAKAPWQVQMCKLADIYDNLLDSAHFPIKQRMRTLQRSERYFNSLCKQTAREAQKPIELVRHVIDEVRTALQSNDVNG